MDVAILFLTLASMIMRAHEGSLEDSIVILSSCWTHDFILLSFFLLYKLKENQSEKLSITLFPRANAGWRGEKKGKTLLNLLSMSTTWPLTSSCWCFVRDLSKDKYRGINGNDDELISSIREWMIWLGGSECVLSWDLPSSFYRWRLMEIRPVIASIPSIGDILNAPNIHRAALLYIFPSIFNEYDRGAWL